MRTDGTLVADACRGDRAAFAELLRRYERAVRAVHEVGNLDAADDVVQETFLIAWQKLGSLRRGEAFGGWLLQVARRTAIRIDRQRKRIVTTSAGAGPVDPSSNGRLAADDGRLLDAVNKLPSHERLVIMLHYFDEHDVNSIAQMTGRPIGTVTKQLSRAHRRLRKWLERERSS